MYLQQRIPVSESLFQKTSYAYWHSQNADWPGCRRRNRKNFGMAENPGTKRTTACPLGTKEPAGAIRTTKQTGSL